MIFFSFARFISQMFVFVHVFYVFLSLSLNFYVDSTFGCIFILRIGYNAQNKASKIAHGCRSVYNYCFCSVNHYTSNCFYSVLLLVLLCVHNSAQAMQYNFSILMFPPRKKEDKIKTFSFGLLKLAVSAFFQLFNHFFFLSCLTEVFVFAACNIQWECRVLVVGVVRIPRSHGAQVNVQCNK